MFCKYCGKESETEVCEECKKNENTQETIEVEAVKVESEDTTTSSTNTQKSKLIAGLLGILLGSLGVHNFYLGYTSKGIAQLLLTLFGWILCGIGPAIAAVWGLVEGISILTGSINVDSDGNPLGE